VILTRDDAICRLSCAVPCRVRPCLNVFLIRMLLLLLLLVHTIAVDKGAKREDWKSYSQSCAAVSTGASTTVWQIREGLLSDLQVSLSLSLSLSLCYYYSCSACAIFLLLLAGWRFSLLAPSITASHRIMAPRRRTSGIHAYSNWSDVLSK
jgi:hypothetical protein